jgi:hypothetical protein
VALSLELPLRTLFGIATVAGVVTTASLTAEAQRGQGPAGPPPTPKAAAAIDLTGTWVSVISEDWALRMVTPAKGNYLRVPITPVARKSADAWDPSRDEAAGEQCKGYGAAGVMRLPGRIRLTWADERTLNMELEAGGQTRVFHFGQTQAPAQPSWQGHSVAEWQYTVNAPRSGDLKVTTTRMRPGYLRKNGVPYSANTSMTEYFHRMSAPNGDTWITVVSEIRDPENLREPFVQSTHFKKVPDSTPFKPEPCSAR